MASADDIKRLRAELQERLASDAVSVESQIETCAAAERLWHSLADDCLARAAKAKTNADRIALIDRARACSAEARDWAHQRRQALKLLKVDLLRRVEERLDKQEQQAERFAEIVDERARRRKLTTARLERARRGEPAGIRGEPADRGAESSG